LISPTLASLRRLRWLSRRRHLGWALLGTVAAFALSLLWSSGYGLSTTLAYLIAVGCLVGGVVTARLIMAERLRVRVVQRTWPPGLMVGLIAGASGTPWAPLPTVRGPARFPNVHLVGPTLLVVVATVLLIQWVTWQVPLTRAVAVAAVTMAMSMLIPLRPMDGAMIGKAGLLVGAVAVAVVALTALGLL
jgi:cellulose synthase operon protein C